MGSSQQSGLLSANRRAWASVRWGMTHAGIRKPLVLAVTLGLKVLSFAPQNVRSGHAAVMFSVSRSCRVWLNATGQDENECPIIFITCSGKLGLLLARQASELCRYATAHYEVLHYFNMRFVSTLVIPPDHTLQQSHGLLPRSCYDDYVPLHVEACCQDGM